MFNFACFFLVAVSYLMVRKRDKKVQEELDPDGMTPASTQMRPKSTLTPVEMNKSSW